ncbi:MAG TPA: TIGR00730 family Rossman fold protein [Gemmatimonadaceae bacterium]|nr:TIGR00730 family Rossman fold protein [Gemmatimonadaceae bacterium]
MTPKRPSSAKKSSGALTVKKAGTVKSPRAAKTPRTASGKPAVPERLEQASKDAVAGTKQRIDEGERASGMFPPKIEAPLPPRAATDDSIGDFRWALTEDAKLLQYGGPKSDFRSTDPWRVMRIMAEFIEGFDKLSEVEKGVSIFGSARTHPDDPQYQAAMETARLLGKEGFSIITGAGPGIMEAANKGAKLGGGASIGCNIELPFEQGSNPYVDTHVAFRYFAVRKTMFIKYSSAFIIFPGGFGTFDELFEALTLIQTGKISQFPVILFGTHYWAGLVRWIRSRVLAERKISPGDMDLMIVTDDPAEAARAVVEAYALQLKTARALAGGR